MVRYSLALLAATAFFAQCAEAQTSIVIQGGTLINGTGRPPIEDSVIVIEGNRFKRVGKRGEVAVPVGAQVVDVSGKHIMPGFIDGHCHLESFWGETYLHLGVTTCVSIETQQNGPWALAQEYGTGCLKLSRQP
jgi:predicted amidohydrolase YtcJ